VSFAAITLCVFSQRVFIVVVFYFVRLGPETFGYTLLIHSIGPKRIFNGWRRRIMRKMSVVTVWMAL
jgi:hypothetical protein